MRTNLNYVYIMMNFIFTLVTLAMGILFGSAGASLSKKRMSRAKTTFAWLGMLPLLCFCCIIAAWCEEHVNTNLFNFIAWIPTVLILIYGTILGVYGSFIPELKKELKEVKKIEWITLACINILTILPAILWIIMGILSPWNCWNSLAIGVALSLTLTTALWIFFHFAWILKYGFHKTVTT